MSCAQVLLIIFAAIFILISLSIIGLSIAFWATTTVALPIIGVIVGGIILIANIFAVAGSGAEKKLSLRPILAVYFLLDFLAILGSALVGSIFFLAHDLVKQYLTLFGESIVDEICHSIPNQDCTGSTVDKIEAIANHVYSYAVYLGGACVGVAVLLLLGLLLSGFILSMKYVVRLLLGFQNLVTLIIGLITAGVGIFGVVEIRSSPLGNVIAIPITVIVLGVVIAFVSFLGCCGACAKSRCPLITYAVFMGIIVVAVVGAIIAAYVFTGQIWQIVHDHLEELKKWFPIQYEGDFAQLMEAFFTVNFRLIAAVLIVFGIFLIWSFVSSIYLTVKFGQPEEETLLAHSDLDVNYALAGASTYGGAVHSAYVSAYPVPATKTRAQTFY